MNRYLLIPLFFFSLFLLPSVTLAAPYESGTTTDYIDLTIVGGQYVWQNNSTSDSFNKAFDFDNPISMSDGDSLAIEWESQGVSCSTNNFYFWLWLESGTPLTIERMSESSTDSGTWEYNATADVTVYTTRVRMDCSLGSSLTFNSVKLNEIEQLSSPTESTTTLDYLLAPPVLTINTLSTTTCTGTSTSSVCVYEYLTSTTTDFSVDALREINKTLTYAFLFALWVTSFLLTFYVIKWLINTKYDHY